VQTDDEQNRCTVGPIALVDEMYRIIDAELTEKQRTALLAELKGMPLEEIGHRMGSNRNAIVMLGTLAITFLTTALAVRGVEPSATPKGLLETILKLSKAKEYDELKSPVVPVHVEHRKLEETVVQEIRRNDENSSGDFAYSDLGLEMVLKKHGDAFQSELSDFWNKELKVLIKDSLDLKEIAWDRYQLLDEGRIHIVVVRIGTSYKLVFWENVNQLLKESRGTAPTKASGEHKK